MLLFMHLLCQALPMIPINFGTEKQEQDQYKHSDFFSLSNLTEKY